ncbi:MAG: YdeI/OmpD-associated family protein [Paracoccaceae bacterium]
MSNNDSTSLKRAHHPMAGFVRDALQDNGLRAAYDDRPPYQRNDYLGWINRAKRNATVQKRLTQMLDELHAGDCYMGMAWRGGR